MKGMVKIMGSTWKDFKSTINTIDQETITSIDTLADLISIRIKSNIPQKEFAERIGMKQPQLAKIEALESVPTLQTISRYAEGLGYKVTLTLTKENEYSA